MIDTIHIAVCMKPLDGNFAQNALEHGVAGLNIDECRIATSEIDAKAMERCNTPGSGRHHKGGGLLGQSFERSKGSGNLDTTQGRFPANVILDGSGEVTEQFPETSGEKNPRILRRLKETTGWSGGSQKTNNAGTVHCDSGSAARYFKECEPDD